MLLLLLLAGLSACDSSGALDTTPPPGVAEAQRGNLLLLSRHEESGLMVFAGVHSLH
jgi:hypothetical protein